ncbi:riboflavin transporter 2 isoform X2 [Frankliniella occidentalis]|uniref:Riboflavin transporter n=1 Tax=Frankliniella occidentalis TaxID=133901 RepID=A0A9C6TU19_FRAOC|nr:riboflavin transporter 2 isoform X2 [Frankliniella occidentalis]
MIQRGFDGCFGPHSCRTSNKSREVPASAAPRALRPVVCLRWGPRAALEECSADQHFHPFASRVQQCGGSWVKVLRSESSRIFPSPLPRHDFGKEATEKTPLLSKGSSPFGVIDCDKSSSNKPSSANMGIFYSLRERLKNRVLLVDVLAALFGMGAWLSINGMYTQLPLLVFNAPEGWGLPSYIVVLIQAANIGGVIYGVMQQFCKGKVSDSLFISILMFIGCLSLLLMSFFYGQTVEIGGNLHSVPLLALVFTCALVACTSSVLFIPYMSRFRETYLVSYMIGEGLSAFVPSITSLLQGVGGNPVCREVNSTDSIKKYEQYVPPPLFSVSTFLVLIFCLQLLSFISFILLKTLPICKKQRNSQSSSSYKNNNENEGVRSSMMPSSPEKGRSLTSDGDNGRGSAFMTESHDFESSPSPVTAQTKMNNMTYTVFLIMQACASALANGLFPAIQSYSCLPYGNVAYHLAINLGSMANPVACYILFFVTFTSLSAISLIAFPTLVVAVFIFVTATMSPEPPLVNTSSGEALVVISWVLFTGLVSYIKLAIATRFRKNGGKGLFWYGAMTQVGSAIGAVTGFALLNYTGVFKSYSPC